MADAGSESRPKESSMLRGQLRNWGGATLLVAVTLFALPIFAQQEAQEPRSRGWFGWLQGGWARIAAIALPAGFHADPNGGDSASPAPPSQAGQPGDSEVGPSSDVN
jgi:hypothetical protein